MRIHDSNMSEAMQQVTKVIVETPCSIEMSWCYWVSNAQDIEELAAEVAQVYPFGNPFGPQHTLLLPNGNLEDTLAFIKWKMEERFVIFFVLWEINIFSGMGTPGAAMSWGPGGGIGLITFVPN